MIVYYFEELSNKKFKNTFIKNLIFSKILLSKKYFLQKNTFLANLSVKKLINNVNNRY